MDPNKIREVLKKEKEKIEKEFNVIITENPLGYIAYLTKTALKRNTPLCTGRSLTELRSTLKLYLS